MLSIIERSHRGIEKIFVRSNEVLSDWFSGLMELPEKFSLFEKIFHVFGYFLAFTCGER